MSKKEKTIKILKKKLKKLKAEIMRLKIASGARSKKKRAPKRKVKKSLLTSAAPKPEQIGANSKESLLSSVRISAVRQKV